MLPQPRIGQEGGVDQIVRQSLQEEPSLPEAGHKQTGSRLDVCNWPPVLHGAGKGGLQAGHLTSLLFAFPFGADRWASA